MATLLFSKSLKSYGAGPGPLIREGHVATMSRYNLRPRGNLLKQSPPEPAPKNERTKPRRRRARGQGGRMAHLDVDGRRLCFRVRNVPRDGHCLYSALAAVLPGNPDPRDLLGRVCAWYISNWTNDVPGSPGLRVHDALQRGVHEAGRYVDELTDARDGASYGGLVELVVLAEVVGASVRVFEVDCTTTHDRYGAEHRPVPARVAFAIGREPYAADLLLHAYGPEHARNHFTALVPVD